MTAARKTSSTRPKAAHAKDAPWDRDNPKASGEHTPLSAPEKAEAKRHAKAAGRPYPNLVDNMNEARQHAAKAAKATKGKA